MDRQALSLRERPNFTLGNGILPGLCPAAQIQGEKRVPPILSRHRGQRHFSRGDGRRLTPVPLPSPAVTPKESMRSWTEFDGAKIAGPPHWGRLQN